MKPLVSIGVPSYNRPKTLRRTLDCLVNQTYSNIEIIVSDNCSTDDEVSEVINSFIKDARVKYFKQEVNKGFVFNFNFVLEKATGEFFMRLADDDWLDLNYIESCVNFLIENTDYAAACGRANIYDLDGSLIKQDVELDLTTPSYAERVLNYYSKVEHNSIFYSLFRRKYYEYLLAKKKLGDDWFIISRIIFLEKIKMLPNIALNIQLGGISKSIDNIVRSLNLSKFERYFPYFSIALNSAKDIVFKSKAYKSINFFKRLLLAYKCFFIIFHRFNFKHELLMKYKKFITN